MIKTISLIWRDDAYDITINSETFEIQSVWRYVDNKASRPEPVAPTTLHPELLQQIDNRYARRG